MAMNRWWLHVQAMVWRMLMKIGMIFHDFPFPSPPSPSFTRKVTPTVSSHDRNPDSLKLLFYTPKDYERSRQSGTRYPVVLNFHGGGFVLGSATDDTRWARAVTEQVNAVFVSVEYHLAPEFPFPAAVDDGVEALIYLAANAEELGIDPHKISLTGFSAGGNLAFTVALRLQYYAMKTTSNTSSSSSNEDTTDTRALLPHTHPHHQATTTTTTPSPIIPPLTILSILSFYPILDFHTPRSHRLAQSLHPSKALPAFLTTLFDTSYIPHLPTRTSPYASPYLAPSSLLLSSLPHDIFLYVCEWDMLLHEGRGFVKRLEKLGKGVRCTLVEGQRHAWDKSPNPWRDQEGVERVYRGACEGMRTVFEGGGGSAEDVEDAE